MGSQDARFNSQIFRKDNPIILACRRDLASFIGARIVPDGNDYLPGQALVRKTSDGLFYRWSAASGGSYDSPVVLFDQSLYVDQQAESPATGGVLVRALAGGLVYTGMLVEADAGFKTAIGAKSITDSAGTQITKF